MAWIANRARDVDDGLPITTGNAIITGPDGATLATIPVDGTTGLAEWKANHQPGKVKWSFTGAGQTKIVEGDAAHQAGKAMLLELQEAARVFGDGVIRGLALSAPGGMVVAVEEGSLYNRGIFDPIYTTENVTFEAANPSNPRIDLIVSRATLTGTFAGKTELAVLKGTAAATPAAPTPTSSSTTNEVEVGRVTIPAGAASITAGMISTSQRPRATLTLGEGSVTTVEILNGTILNEDIAAGTIGPEKLNFSIGGASGLMPGLINTFWISAQNVLGGFFGDNPFEPGGFQELEDGIQLLTNTLYGCPIFIPKATTLKGMAFDVVTLGGGLARLGLYRAGGNGLPTTLFHDAGQKAIPSSGLASVTGLNISMPAGFYWAAIVVDNAVRVQNLIAIRDFFGSPGPGDNTPYGWVQGAQSGVGALPGAYPTPGISANGPNLWVQTAGTS